MKPNPDPEPDPKSPKRGKPNKVAQRQLQQVLLSLLNDVPTDLDSCSIAELSANELTNRIDALRQVIDVASETIRTLRENKVLRTEHATIALDARRNELLALYVVRYGDARSVQAKISELTPGDARQSDDATRLHYLRNLRLEHPAQRRIQATMEYIHHATQPGKPHNLMLLGPPFVGKSDVLSQHYRKYVKGDGEYITFADPVLGEIKIRRQSVVHVECPNNGLSRSVLRVILMGMCDPRASKVKVEALSSRICDDLEMAETRLLMIDDINHCIQVGDHEGRSATRSREAIYNVAKALRELAAQIVLRSLSVSIILAGVPISALLREVNAQFAYRFREVEKIEPYSLEEGRADDAVIFVNMVASLYRSLPLRDQPDIGEADFGLILKLHWATRGNIGLLVTLVKTAAEYALALGCERLREEHLEYAFKSNRLSSALPLSTQAGSELPRSNPFRGDGDMSALDIKYRRIRSLDDLF